MRSLAIFVLHRTLRLAALVSTVGMSAIANAGMFGFGGDSWKEEVLLHDGSKIIVTRSQSYGGRHELGQAPPVKEHTITFSLPNSGEAIRWTSEYGEDIGRTNFNLLALHVLNGTPYLVTEPNLCLSYNKWGRPNPPYVVFRKEEKQWIRIPLKDIPAEFSAINLIVNEIRQADIAKYSSELGYVSNEHVKKINSSLEQPEYKIILREPQENGIGVASCEKLVPYGISGWLGLDWFSDQPTYEACTKFCDQKKVAQQNCPCQNLFKGVK